MSTSHARQRSRSLEEVHGSVATTDTQGFIRRLLAFAGPAFLVSVGYMDPGNWATDIEGGSRFGYQLLWVLLMSNAMALLLQTLSARMGLVMGHDLAQACRARYPRVVSLSLWLLCEVAIAACDLAEVIGTVIGLKLLFGLPLELGLLLTIFDTFLLLTLQQRGIRKMEAFILTLVFTIGACFVFEILWSQPEWSAVLRGLLPSLSPSAPFVFQNDDALYIAIGIIGATVMPHNLYLHSALVQTRSVERTTQGIKRACWYNFLDTTIALNAAFFVNASILVLSAAAFYGSGIAVSDIEDAHRLLPQFLGPAAASTLFAVALLCAGQSSTLTGTLAGQIVMEGFLNFRISPWLRRLITRAIAIIPAMITVYWFGGHGLKDLLILSQVVLSLQLPFAIIPLIQMTSDAKWMHSFVNPRWVKALAWLSAGIIVTLNINLVRLQIGEWGALLATSGYSLILYAVVIPLLGGCGVLFTYLLIEPYIRRRGMQHAEAALSEGVAATVIDTLDAPAFRHIGVAVEHSPHDVRALRHALQLARQHGADIVILHVVDGVGGQWYGTESMAQESIIDRTYVDDLAAGITKTGVRARGVLLFGNPARELVRAIEEESIDIIILRGHGHGFFADRFFGQTIDSIRHATTVPVLAVR